MNIKEMCEQYKMNYFEIQKLEDLLHKGHDFSSWLASMKERAMNLQGFYSKNNELIRKVTMYECEPFKDEDEAQALYDIVLKMYEDYVNDPEFLVPLLRKMISYYERKRNVPYLIQLYYMAFFLINEMECRSANAKADLTYQLKTLELKRYYRTLSEIDRKTFFRVYSNLATVCPMMNGTVTPQESYFWYKEALEFYYSDVVQPIDKDNSNIEEIITQMKYDWITIIDNANDLSVEALSDLFRLIQDLYDEELDNHPNNQIDPFVYSSYLEMERIMHKKTLGQVIMEYMEYFRYNLSLAKDNFTEDNFYFLMSTPSTIERWLSKSQDTFFKKKIFDEINDAMMLNYRKFSKEIPSSYIHQMLAEWCELSIKYLTKREEKENAIFELVIKNQIPTYLHSVMVMNLSTKLFEVAYRKRPELFKDLHMGYDELYSYVEKAALFHDIGKIKITDVINRQGRKLSNTEFEGIMNHPSFGMSLIESDIDLSIYADVIRYHHKYYDGTKGYPYGNDNTKSKYRIIIDLVTLCDCMDAATDFLGRNYKISKNVSEVLDEFKAGKGTRYNPDLVDIIIQSETLMKEFEKITIENRARYMYDAYIESKDILKNSKI